MNNDGSKNGKRAHSESTDEEGNCRPSKKVVIAPTSNGGPSASGSRAVGVSVAPNLLTLSTTATVDAMLDAATATEHAAAISNESSGSQSRVASPNSRGGASTTPSGNRDNGNARTTRTVGIDIDGPSSTGGVLMQLSAAGGVNQVVNTDDIWRVDRTQPYAQPHWWVDVYDVLTSGKWPQGIPWAINGDHLAPRPVIDNGRPPEVHNSDDEEDRHGNWWDYDIYIPAVGSEGQVARRIRRRDRARYLERVVFALIDLRMEHVEHDEVCLPDGFVVKREVWRGSTFQVGRCQLPPWKLLIDDHKLFHSELTREEKAYEKEHGDVVLMEPPLRKPLEGEYARWGEEADYPPDAYGVERPRVPERFPFVPDPFQSDDDEDMDEDMDEDNDGPLRVRMSSGAGSSSQVRSGHDSWF